MSNETPIIMIGVYDIEINSKFCAASKRPPRHGKELCSVPFISQVEKQDSRCSTSRDHCATDGDVDSNVKFVDAIERVTSHDTASEVKMAENPSGRSETSCCVA